MCIVNYLVRQQRTRAPKRDAAVMPSGRWQIWAREAVWWPTFQPSRDFVTAFTTRLDR
jgi:hypothetical protein